MTAIDVATDLAPGVRVRRWPWTRGTVTRPHEFWGWFVKWDNKDDESGPYLDDELTAHISCGCPKDLPARLCARPHCGAGSTAPSGASPLLGAPNETRNQ